MMPPLKKRNPQDATRKHDVDPLRKRIEVLERDVKKLKLLFFGHGLFVIAKPDRKGGAR